VGALPDRIAPPEPDPIAAIEAASPPAGSAHASAPGARHQRACHPRAAARAGAQAIPDETRLVLYALHQQATVGPCTEGKPWAWNVVESAKWQSWVQLGDMSSVEAMRLYVKLLDEEVQARAPGPAREAAGPAAAVAVQARSRLRARRAQPDWWARKEAAAAAPLPADAEPDAAAPPPGDTHALEAAAAADAWAAPHVEGARRPPPRYEHAVVELGGHMYVVGGNCGASLSRRPPARGRAGAGADGGRARAGGRYLGDVWALELATLTWRPVSGVKSAPPTPQPPPREGDALPPPPPGGLPPCAGHALVAWGTQLLCLGGHTKARPRAHARSAADATAQAPGACRCHSPAGACCPATAPGWRAGEGCGGSADRARV